MTITDSADRFRGVAQAAQWLSEGKKLQHAWYGSKGCRAIVPETGWRDLVPDKTGVMYLNDRCQYRIKPDPPQPRDWYIAWDPTNQQWISVSEEYHGAILVREVIE